MPGIYLSIPFCSQKCTYCNFASGVFPRELERKYINAISAELRSANWPWLPETVYLGGGTPGSMLLKDVVQLLSLIPGHPWTEATLEAAPGAITPEQVHGWTDAGINRVSLGVQSFVDSELRRTGRRHDAGSVQHDCEVLRAGGIEEINIDLIAGLPGQTAESWEQSLDWIAKLAPTHASVYMLEVDEDSRLGRELLLGGGRFGARDVPSDEEISTYYEHAVARLAEVGLMRYEISNFALPGHESRHNLKYWRLEPYLGFGSDAHSFDGFMRWQNLESPDDYVAAFESGRGVRSETVPASAEEERFFVGLRLMEGICPTRDEWQRWEEPITRFLADGLLEKDGGALKLTSRGVLLSNEVFAEFLNDD